MAAKIDKDALKKNGFWIGLGTFFVLWIVVLIIVMVSNQRKKLEEEFQAKKKALDSELSRGVKSELTPNPFTKDWVVFGKKFSDHKEVIWREAWASQRDMYTWPEGITPPHYKDQMMTFKPPWEAPAESEEDKRRKEAYEAIRRREDASMRAKYRDGGYISQFAGLEGIVFPATFNGGFDAVFPAQKWDMQLRPTHEEVLLAQEDFWARREMLNIVRTTLDNVREMKEITDDKRLPKRDPKSKEPVTRRIFRNAYWELDLVFKPGKGTRWVISEESKIKNVSTGGKTLPLIDLSTNLGLPFHVSQADGTGSPVTWRISGEPVGPNASRSLKEQSFATVDLRKPIKIHQFLFWEISPVRRIDALALSQHSHRTVTAGLKANERLKKLEPAPEPGEGGTGGTGGTGEGGGMMIGTPTPGAAGGGPSAMGPGGGGSATDVTRINKIPRKRYMHVTAQTRHLPIAMRVVVDEAHIHDVLAAVSNNRMRIQITQVVAHHIPGLDAPLSSGGTTGEEGPGGVGGAMGPGPGGSMGLPKGPMMPRPGAMGGRSGGMYGPNSYSGGFSTGRGGPKPPMGFGSFVPTRPTDLGEGVGGAGGPREGTVAESTSQFKDTARLVELSIYGIASLYDPFKPGVDPTAEVKPEDKTDGN